MDGDGMLGNKEEYSRYYGDFRGVDFSNDHTQVHDQRFAYAVNMYRDYQSGQGKCIETIPGFRRRVNGLSSNNIWGIHQIKICNGDSFETKVLIHVGDRLYRWDYQPGYGGPGVVQSFCVQLGEPENTWEDGVHEFCVAVAAFPGRTFQLSKEQVLKSNGERIYNCEYTYENGVLLNGELRDDVLMVTIESSELASGQWVRVEVFPHYLSWQENILLLQKKSVSLKKYYLP